MSWSSTENPTRPMVAEAAPSSGVIAVDEVASAITHYGFPILPRPENRGEYRKRLARTSAAVLAVICALDKA